MNKNDLNFFSKERESIPPSQLPTPSLNLMFVIVMQVITFINIINYIQTYNNY